MDIDVDIAIIGAGTAGLSAFREARKQTESLLLIDSGPLGTTCARVGCMPSKALIQIADDFYRRHLFQDRGILGSEQLQIDPEHAFKYVRQLRDQWVSGVIDGMKSMEKKLIIGSAQFIEPGVIAIDNKRIRAKNIIIATGSRSIMPAEWEPYSNQILTSETIFEQQHIANNIAIIGLGVIGIELGQALTRLGINTIGVSSSQFIGGLSDPIINETAIEIFQKELPLHLNQSAELSRENNALHISNDIDFIADQALIAIGRQSNLDQLNLACYDWSLDKHGIPTNINPNTLQVGNSRVFIAGDVNNHKPLLHEAADEGRIAGFNATQKTPQCFKRRTRLEITFSHPNIAIVGKAFRELNADDIIIGEANFENQGRSVIIGENKGKIRIYAEPNSGLVIGAEMIAPMGEHMAHLLAWAIEQQLTVFEILRNPYYHPSVEEGMRTALRDLSKKVQKTTTHFDLAICNSSAATGLI